jgi:hypothetical protein
LREPWQVSFVLRNVDTCGVVPRRIADDGTLLSGRIGYPSVMVITTSPPLYHGNLQNALLVAISVNSVRDQWSLRSLPRARANRCSHPVPKVSITCCGTLPWRELVITDRNPSQPLTQTLSFPVLQSNVAPGDYFGDERCYNLNRCGTMDGQPEVPPYPSKSIFSPSNPRTWRR